MKRLLPVIHIKDEAQTLRNAALCDEAKVAGVFLIHHRADYKALLAVAESVHAQYPRLWVGINGLDLTAAESFQLLPMWVNGIWSDNVGVTETDYGIFNRIPAAFTRHYRRLHSAEYFGGFAFKYQHPVTRLQAGAEIAANYCDVVTTSGDGTGVAADLTKIRLIKHGLPKGTRLGIASGITPENVKSYLPYVDDFLVATGISDDEYNLNREKLLSINAIIANYK